MMLHDRASKEMKYDIDLPENQVATPSTVTKPTVPNPAFVPVPHQPQAPCDDHSDRPGNQSFMVILWPIKVKLNIEA